MDSTESTNTSSSSQTHEASIEHVVGQVIDELVPAEDNNNFPDDDELGATSTTASATTQRSTINGMMIELQNTLSVMCYQRVNKNTMKHQELCNKMHAELFSTSSRVGYVEQLMNGEGPLNAFLTACLLNPMD